MGQLIDFTRPDGRSSPGFLCAAGAPDAPGLVLIQEWWGLKPHILALCERFAGAGFTTLAPDLYRGRIAASADEAAHMMSGLDFVDACDQDLAGAAAALRERGAGKIGVLGFCMGGALTVAAAVRLPGLSAACCFYGIPPRELAEPERIALPFQGHFAERDDWCTPDAVQAFEAQLRGPQHEIHRYAAEHAFFNNSRPEVYDADCAALAWQRSVEFLQRHLA